MPKRKPKQHTAELNPQLIDFWLETARNKVLYGGRASSKSWDAAGFAIWLSQRFQVKFLCTRQFQNRIEDSVYTLLKNQISRFGLNDVFRVTNNRILNIFTGSEFVFYGLWRHIEEIKSMENVDICWIEEGHSLTPRQWEILEPTIRKEGSQFWIIFNPQIISDFVYQRFVVNPPANTVGRKINYTENQFLSQTVIDVIDSLKEEDPEEYEHIYLGVPRNDDESAIIKRSWLNAAVDAHIKLNVEPMGAKRIGFDVADSGGDKCVNLYAYGCLAVEQDSWKANEDELMKSCRRTYGNAQRLAASVTYDATGVGAFCGSKFEEINEDEDGSDIDHEKFQAGGSVINPDREYAHGIDNKDMFSNLKAQSWWSVADRLRNTWDAVTNGTQYPQEELICISSEMEDLEPLLTELATPKKDYDKVGRVMVESKKDLEKREISSPDRADAFVMAFAPVSTTAGFFDVFLDR